MSNQALIKEAVSAGIAAAVEVMVRGITANDLQETSNTPYPNKDISGTEHQGIIENIVYNPNKKPLSKMLTKPAFTRVDKRKYQAIYGLKTGQSSFYPLPNGRGIEGFHTLVQKSTGHARRHTPSAQFVTQRSLENGVLGVRVYRVK